MKASIKQIIQMTGYSPATVSNALNRKKGVSSEAIERIQQAADELGYQFSKSVNKIKFVTYRKNGSIIDDSLIFPAMIEGVERQANELGYETTFCLLNYEDEFFEEKLVEVLTDISSFLILLGTEMQEEDFEKFLDYKGHMVVLDGWSENMGFDGILINNTDAACKAVNYLVEKGHKEIGYLRGVSRIKAFCYREYGYKRSLQSNGLKLDQEYMVTLGTKVENAYEDMKQFLKKNPRLPTAYFADNDLIALGALKALQERGIRVPEDVSIIGFDDMKFGAVSSPRLTTIHVFKHEMGEVAVRRVLDHVKYSGNQVKMKIQVGTKFIERESVKDLNY